MLQTGKSRKNTIYLSLFTFLSAILCSLFGYLALPLAAAFYSSVLLAERNSRPFFSYVLPILSFIVNFFLNGIFSFEGIAYAIIGFIIYLAYVKSRKKAETAFYTSIAAFLLIIASLLIYPFNEMGVVRLSAIREFYYYVLTEIKSEFINYVTQIVSENELGIKSFAFNLYEANDLFVEIMMLIIPAFMISAFLISGVSLKLFSSFKSHYKLEKEEREWSFSLSTTTAVFYIVVSFISSVATGSDVFSMSASILYYFFFAVFAYIGLKLLYGFVYQKLSKTFSLILVFLILFSFSLLPYQILSYVGAISSIIKAKKARGNNK